MKIALCGVNAAIIWALVGLLEDGNTAPYLAPGCSWSTGQNRLGTFVIASSFHDKDCGSLAEQTSAGHEDHILSHDMQSLADSPCARALGWGV